MILDTTLSVSDRVPAIDSIVRQEIVCEHLKRDLPRRRLAVHALTNLLESVAQHFLGYRLQRGSAAFGFLESACGQRMWLLKKSS
jgi:hypothetical protein